MLKLLAEVDEFILNETSLFCENSTTSMTYSYKKNEYYTISFIIHTLINDNLWLIIKENEDMEVIIDEFNSFEQFKKFFCNRFEELLL